MVFPLILTETDETMKDLSRLTGPHLSGIINKFPDLKQTETKIGPHLMGIINKAPGLKNPSKPTDEGSKQTD